MFETDQPCCLLRWMYFHYTHRYAASIDDILEEEEHYADQIKEYLSYAEALR